ncbi:MAG: transposase [Bdellovibrionaceae bacterium]|nr:transposase [Pseudobdellovibrionaceae bacterium]
MHLTLRSSKAKGDRSFRYDKNRIKKLEVVIQTQAQKFGVEICGFANVGNHIHMLVKPSYRSGFKSSLKAISGIIARIALGAERGNAKTSEAARGFWDQNL